MTLGDVISETVALMVGENGLLGDDFTVFIAAAVVTGLGIMQFTRLYKRFR